MKTKTQAYELKNNKNINYLFENLLNNSNLFAKDSSKSDTFYDKDGSLIIHLANKLDKTILYATYSSWLKPAFLRKYLKRFKGKLLATYTAVVSSSNLESTLQLSELQSEGLKQII